MLTQSTGASEADVSSWVARRCGIRDGGRVGRVARLMTLRAELHAFHNKETTMLKQISPLLQV
ncbi:MAG TPA: hypothetical protein VFD27_20790, partial [Chthoniobacteraceae bacterium]|nr:hypothetical protein [Chthoniobacteraceae bacterium]